MTNLSKVLINDRADLLNGLFSGESRVLRGVNLLVIQCCLFTDENLLQWKRLYKVGTCLFSGAFHSFFPTAS